VRVLYFVSRPQNFTGSQRAIGVLAANAPAGVERCVLCSDEGRAPEAYRARGIPVHVRRAPRALGLYERAVLNGGRAGQALVFARDLLPYTLTLWRFIRRWRPDVVHCDTSRGVLLAGPAARLAGRPVLWHVQSEENVLAAHSHLGRVAAALTTAVARCADGVGEGLPPRLRPRTIRYGIEPGTPSPEVRRRSDGLLRGRGLEPGRCVRVLTAASMVPFKGLHHLADALGALLRERPGLAERVAWFVLGDARAPEAVRYREFLAGRVEANGLGRNVFWLGWQDNAFAWMDACEVVAIPTVLREPFAYPGEPPTEVRSTEGLPLTLLEAQQAGRPAVATDVGGVAEALEDGRTGLLVRPGSADALKEALATLLDDPERRRQMGEAARERSRLFAAERMVAEFNQLYREMVPHADSA
jgi:glycosyltransferase involved in cell wall biosynthesis